MARTKSYNLLEAGNWREVQPVDQHDIYIVSENEEEDLIVIYILIVLMLIAAAVIGFKLWKAKKAQGKVVALNGGV